MNEIIITSIFLGVGLAMDACCVSLSDGMKENKMKLAKILFIALMFGVFQGLMPLIGYLLGSKILTKIEWIIPYIALFILGFLGIKMIIDGIKNKENSDDRKLTLKLIFIQAIATSIDALSVGLTISNYTLNQALICVSFVAIITFLICFISIFIGKKFGDKFGNKAIIAGGIILIAIGLEIFISSFI